MAIAISVARFGANSWARPRDFAGRSKRWRSPRCASVSPPCEWRQSRRLVSISLALSYFLFDTNCAVAADGAFDKYVKRKKLDPLVSYVPAVILSQFQIKELEYVLEGESPQFASCRSLLRSGPASSLRINIRAVAQYAAESGNGKTASDEVDQCLRALEELDNLLLRASRNDSGASVKSMKAQINVTLESLDRLLKTVPSEVLEKGQAIADSYRNLDEDEAPPDTSSDKDLKQLEAIL